MRSTDCLFLKERTIIGTATKRFAARLRTLVSHHCEEIRTWAVPERIKGHSSRKGTATYVTAATLNPPPLSSIAHRGEWSQGKVQDIYFNFAQPGDHYLGRMLAGLNPTSPSFKVLPPHFTCGLENKYVKEGVELCYGTNTKDTTKLRLSTWNISLVLASVVYHETWIRGFVHNNKKHPFSNLFLLENADLIRNLKVLITTEQTENMPSPTGIPTHIDLQSIMEEILLGNNKFLEKLELQSTIIQEAVKKAIQENDVPPEPLQCQYWQNNSTITINQLLILSKRIVQNYQMIVVLVMMSNNETDQWYRAGELLFVKEFQKGTEKSPDVLLRRSLLGCSKEI